LGLVDGPVYLQKMAEFMGPVFKAQGLPKDIPQMKASPGKGYFGMSLTLEPERGSFDMWLSVTGVREIRRMLQPLFGEGIVQ